MKIDSLPVATQVVTKLYLTANAPLPTAAPFEGNPNRRHAESRGTDTCGYWRGDSGSPAVCLSSWSCSSTYLEERSLGIFQCCDFEKYDCSWYIRCVLIGQAIVAYGSSYRDRISSETLLCESACNYQTIESGTSHFRVPYCGNVEVGYQTIYAEPTFSTPFTFTDTITTPMTRRQIADPQKQHTSMSSMGTTKSKSLNIGAIIGGIAGGLALLAALLSLVAWSRYRRHHGSKRAFFIVQKGPGLGPGTSRPNAADPATTSRSTVSNKTAYQPIPTIHLSNIDGTASTRPQRTPPKSNRASSFIVPFQNPSIASSTDVPVELVDRVSVDSRPCTPTLPPARSAGGSKFSELGGVSVKKMSGRGWK